MTEENGSATAGSPAEAGTNPTATPEVTQEVTADVTAETKPANATVNPFEGINEEYKGFIEKNGYKSMDDVLKSAVNAEKFIGTPTDRLVKIPNETSTAEEIAAFHKKLGTPEKAEDYKIAVPEGFPEEFGKSAANEFHKLGISTKQAEALVKFNNDNVAQQMQLNATNLANKKDTDMKALEQEWGNASKENIEIAKQGAKEFGLEEDDLSKIENSIGTNKMMKAFHAMGLKIAEPKLAGLGKGPTATGRYTKEGAVAKYKELKNDKEWLGKFKAGNTEVIAQRDRLIEDMGDAYQ